MDYKLEQRKPITPKIAPFDKMKAQGGLAATVTTRSPPVDNSPRGYKIPPAVAKNNTPVIQGAQRVAGPKTGALKSTEYTDEEIRNLTSDGYIMVYPGLWDRIPKGAHIRFVKKDDGSGKSRGLRFKPGGFVRTHYTTNEGEKMMIIENKLNGKPSEAGHITFPLAYNDLETIWKKYEHDAFIEIHLIYNSLAQKKKQIEDLTARVDRLENILRSAIK